MKRLFLFLLLIVALPCQATESDTDSDSDPEILSPLVSKVFPYSPFNKSTMALFFLNLGFLIQKDCPGIYASRFAMFNIGGIYSMINVLKGYKALGRTRYSDEQKIAIKQGMIANGLLSLLACGVSIYMGINGANYCR